jgi:non-heme chloroperoxidase
MNTIELTNIPVKQAEVNGTKLAYIEQGSGEAIVFIHGAVSDFRTWTEQFNAFSKDYRVISYSRRSHYPNENDSNYTRALHSSDLVEFLKALNLEKAHLVGHSYGASIALMAALEKPELVETLVLGEPVPFPELFDEEEMPLLSEQKKGFDLAARLAKIGDKKAAVREFLHTIVGIDVLGLLPEARRRVVLENAGTLVPMLQNYYDSPVSIEDLKNVKVPTLLITGELSPAIARLSNKMIKRNLPNSEIAILKGASHGLQMENPGSFNQMVRDFLAINKDTTDSAKKQRLYEAIF